MLSAHQRMLAAVASASVILMLSVAAQGQAQTQGGAAALDESGAIPGAGRGAIRYRREWQNVCHRRVRV
jgi:hypothetical protein